MTDDVASHDLAEDDDGVVEPNDPAAEPEDLPADDPDPGG
jgi:hypothetical protein